MVSIKDGILETSIIPAAFICTGKSTTALHMNTIYPKHLRNRMCVAQSTCSNEEPQTDAVRIEIRSLDPVLI